MVSFKRPDADGWRYDLSYRTRREGDGWTVQRWNGQTWEHVEGPSCLTYAHARELATEDRGCRQHEATA